MSLRASFQHHIADGLVAFGFDMVPKQVACARRFAPRIEQRVELVRTGTAASGRVLTPFVVTCVDAFRDAPCDYGVGLDWTFPLGALVDHAAVACELQLSPSTPEGLLEAWLASVGRELQEVGLAWFESTRSLEQLLEFAVGDFCRARAASYSESFARLQRAMLLRLVGRALEVEHELELAAAACHWQLRDEHREFAAFVRGGRI